MILETFLRTIAITALAGFSLAAFRVRSATVKLAVWRLVLYTSLLMPLAALIPEQRAAVVRIDPPAPVIRVFSRVPAAPPAHPSRQATPDWPTLAWRAYAIVAGLLLLRAALAALRLRQLPTSPTPLANDVFESPAIDAPLTHGLRIILPCDWTNWSEETLTAVIAHERAHLAERDFRTRCLSQINRAVYWVNPLAWWLDRQLAQLAEQAADDAALQQFPERPAYAGILLGFAQRRAEAFALSMARPVGLSTRIDRILDDSHQPSAPVSAASRRGIALAVFAVALLIGAFRLTTGVATAAAQANPPHTKPSPTPAAPAPAQESTNNWTSEHPYAHWALIHRLGNNMDGGMDADDRARALRAQANHDDYLWFTLNGKEYILDDPKTIAEIDSWFEPLKDLGQQQDKLSARQGELGSEMAKLSQEMAHFSEQMARVKIPQPDTRKLNAELAKLNKLLAETKEIDLEKAQELLGNLQGQLAEVQDLASSKQSRFAELEASLADKQALLGDKQGELGNLQSELGEQQAKFAEEIERKLHRLFDRAIQDHRARPVTPPRN